MSGKSSIYTDHNGHPYPDCPVCGSSDVYSTGIRAFGNGRRCSDCGHGWVEQ